MMILNKKNELYLAPDAEVLEIAVEQGFAGSIEDPDVNDEMDW